MEEIDVVRLLQHYRHDLMNKLQLVHGYLNMNKMEKVEEKIDELFSHFNVERKLIGLEAPKFILWLIQFNHVYKNFRMTYTIDIEGKSLRHLDEALLTKCRSVMDYCNNISDPLELYDIELVLRENQETNLIEAVFYMKGFLDNRHIFTFQEENKEENIELMDDGIVCQFKIPTN